MQSRRLRPFCTSKQAPSWQHSILSPRNPSRGGCRVPTATYGACRLTTRVIKPLTAHMAAGKAPIGGRWSFLCRSEAYRPQTLAVLEHK